MSVVPFVSALGQTHTNEVRDSLFPSPALAVRRLPPVDDEPTGVGNSAWETLPLEIANDDGPGDDDELPAAGVASRPTDRGGMGGMFGGGGGSPIGYRFFGEPERPVEGQAGDFAHWGQEIRLSYPVWKSAPHVVLVSTSVTNDLYDTSAVFPRGTEFPGSLWNIRLGANYFRSLANDWKLGGGVNIGSASDVPFGALRDVNPAVFSFLRIPRGENAWNLSVFYSPLSEIPFPIPGVAYYWHVSDELQMNVGIPAQLTWKPSESFTFAASYMLLHTINVRGTWHFDEAWSAYVAYENRNRSWFLHDRVRDDERLFAYDQGVLVGLQRRFWSKFQAEVMGGYLFERFYFIGADYADRNRDRIDIEAGATMGAQVGIAW